MGRRKLLCSGLAGMAVSLCALAGAFLVGTGSGLVGWLTAASLTA